MSCAQLHLINSASSCLAIVQGETFKGKAIWRRTENLTGWQPRGRIKWPTGSASFVFPAIEWVPVLLDNGTTANRSLIKPVIAASVTAIIPATSTKLPKNFNLAAEPSPGRYFWEYEIEAVAPTIDPLLGEPDVIKICPPSWVQVIGEVEKSE